MWVRKKCRKAGKCIHCNKKRSRLSNCTPVSVYFCFPINPFFCYKTETSDCDVVTVLNSMPLEMYPTGRRVKQRALPGMNVISNAAVCALFSLSSTFIPHLLFRLTFTLSLTQQCPSSGLFTSLQSFAVTQILCVYLTTVCWSFPPSSFFQIISLLNVFTPQKSLEEFQDVWVVFA